MKPRYDCILMLSGGKDSTYLAYKLDKQGRRPLAITVDVGFMADCAKDNIELLKDDLHLDHLWVKSQPAAHAKVIEEFRGDTAAGLRDVCGSCTLLTMQTVLSIARDMDVKQLFCGFTKYSAFTSTKQAQVKLPGGFIYENPYVASYNLPRMEAFLAMRGFTTDPTLTNCDHIREIIIRHTQRFGVNPYEEEFTALLDAKQITEEAFARMRAWCTPAEGEFPELGSVCVKEARPARAEQMGAPRGAPLGGLWMRA